MSKSNLYDVHPAKRAPAAYMKMEHDDEQAAAVSTLHALADEALASNDDHDEDATTEDDLGAADDYDDGDEDHHPDYKVDQHNDDAAADDDADDDAADDTDNADADDANRDSRADGLSHSEPGQTKVRTSLAWQHFSQHAPGKMRCAYCSKLVAYRGGSTSNLFRHLRKSHDIGQFEDVRAAAAAAVAAGPKELKVRRRRSVVWQHFTLQAPGKARCSYCNQVLGSNNNSNLCRHLQIRHGIRLKEDRPADDGQRIRNATRVYDAAEMRASEAAAATSTAATSTDAASATAADGREEPERKRIETISRKRSLVWEHFKPYSVDRAQCAYCDKVLSFNKGCVSNLSRHLWSRHDLRPQPGGERGPVSAMAVREAQCRIKAEQLKLKHGDEHVPDQPDDNVATINEPAATIAEQSLWHYFLRVDDVRQQCNLCQRHFVCTPDQMTILANHLSTEHQLKVVVISDDETPETPANVEHHVEPMDVSVSFTVHADGTCEMDGARSTADRDVVVGTIGDEPATANVLLNDSSSRHSKANPSKSKASQAERPTVAWHNRKRSYVWEHFTELSASRARCTYCDRVFSFTGSSISNLGRHLMLRHRVPQQKGQMAAAPRDVRSLWAHFERLDEKRQQCRLCLRHFVCAAHQHRTLVKHLKTVHGFTLSLNVEVPAGAIVEEHLEQMDVSALKTLNTTAEDDAYRIVEEFTVHNWKDDVTVEDVVESMPYEKLASPPVRTKPPSNTVGIITLDDKALRECLTGVLGAAEPPPKSERFQTASFVDALTIKYQAVIGRIKAQLQRTDHVALSASLHRIASSVDSSERPIFLAITAHFITQPDWRMHAVLLNCGSLEGIVSLDQPIDRSQRANATHWLQQACTFWGIGDRVFAIVTEDAATSSGDEERPGIFWTAANSFGWSQLQCLDRRLGVAITHGLLANEFECMRLRFKSLFAWLATNRRLATSFRYFYEQEQRTLAAEEMPQFDIDEETGRQWRHTFEDVRRACALQQPLDAALETHMHRISANGDEVVDDEGGDGGGQPTGKLTTAEWMAMRAVRRMLQLYHEALEELRNVGGAASVSTSKAIVLLHCVSRQLDELGRSTFETASTRDIAQNLQLSVQEGIQDVECDLLLAVCTFLDPRFKGRAFQRPNALRICRLHVEMLTSKLSMPEPETTAAPSPQTSMWWWMEKQRSEQRHKQPSNLEQAKREIEFYSEQMVLQRGDDPLRWWRRVGCETCPRLARLAGKYLALPATCALSRRALAATERLLAPEWRLGSRHTAKMVLFVQENMAYFDEEEAKAET